MKNRDNYKEEYVHLYIALRRRKENSEGKELCFREIIKDEKIDLKNLENRLSTVSGTWRIHKTINSRSMRVAVKELQKLLIDDPERALSIQSDLKTQLMKPKAKAQRNILIDYDVECSEKLLDLSNLLDSNKVSHSYCRTPNGWHIICEKFDTRIVDNIKDLTIQRDGYKFIKKVDVQ